jgi:hypothetical protein
VKKKRTHKPSEERSATFLHQSETLRNTVNLRNALLFQLQSALDLTSTISPRYITLHFMWWVNGGVSDGAYRDRL